MRPERLIEPVEARVAALNEALGDAPAETVLGHALQEFGPRIALVSSFGADSVVLLHLLSRIAPDAPVLFLDTEMLFPATIAYQKDVARHLGLTGVRRIRPDRSALFEAAPDGDLHLRDADLCCQLRKTEPLEAALRDFGAWITGRKRHQTPERASLGTFDADAAGRIRVNPLARWSREEVAAHIDRHALPRHPLVADGYLSIGCAPCTTRVAPDEDARAGRWRGTGKTECGIHLKNGRYVRAGESR